MHKNSISNLYNSTKIKFLQKIKYNDSHLITQVRVIFASVNTCRVIFDTPSYRLSFVIFMLRGAAERAGMRVYSIHSSQIKEMLNKALPSPDLRFEERISFANPCAPPKLDRYIHQQKKSLSIVKFTEAQLTHD